MRTSMRHKGSITLLALVAALLLVSAAFAQSGHVLNGVSAIDQGMAGAGMAAPSDPSATLHWNPAAVTALDRTALSFGAQVLFPSTTLTSQVDQGAFGPQFPPTSLTGVSESNAGPFPIPAAAYVNAGAQKSFAWGLSAFGVGGFGVDYQLDPTNPILTPQAPMGMGFGAVTSQFSMLQMAPTLAYRVSNVVSVGVAPTVNFGQLEVTPFPATFPDDANGDGFGTYPGAPTESSIGYGVQAGIHAQDLSGFNLGASFKSTQYFSDFEFTSEDEVGGTRSFAFDLDYPMIISGAVAYTGFNRLVISGDVRYIDFENTNGFETVGFDNTGAMLGFGWESIFVYAAGLEYQLTDKMPVRLGYSFNDNPISDAHCFYNISSPAIVQNRIDEANDWL